MNHLHVKYLIAGGGIAASAAAEAIRSLDAEGSLLMIGQEANRPYNRPALSKDFLAHRNRRDDLFTLAAGWFAEHHVDLRTGRRVAHLDTSRNSAVLDSGEDISFDRLLIATGATPRRLRLPGADLPNLFYLRTLDDAHRIGHAIDVAQASGIAHDKGRGRVVVVGAGLLGVELAASLATLNLAVDLLVGAPLPWPMLAGEVAGAVVLEHLLSLGVAVHNDRWATAFRGAGRVQHVSLDDGSTIDCDLAIAAVGCIVNLNLLRGTTIAAETAILTDSHCRTSTDTIFAAGDCAAIYDPLFGKYRMIDHWDHARLTGTLAGTNMAGGDSSYDAVSAYNTIAGGLSMTVWGEPKRIFRRIIRRSIGSPHNHLIEIGIDTDDCVCMVLQIGHRADTERLPSLVRRRLNVAGHETDLADGSVPI